MDRSICGQTDDVTSDQYLILLLGLPQASQDGRVQIYSGIVPQKAQRCYAFSVAHKGMAIPAVDAHASRPQAH